MATNTETQAAFYRRQEASNDAMRSDINDAKLRGTVSSAVQTAIRTATTPTATHEQRYENAFTEYLRRGIERRDLTEATNSAGGYAVPTRMYNELLTDMKSQSALVGHANVVETPLFGGPLNYPVLKDSAYDAGQVADGTLEGEQDFVLGNIAFGDCPTYVAGGIRMSMALAQDTTFDLETVLAEAWNLRTARGLEADATTTVIAGCAATTTAGAGVLAYADLVTAYFAIDPAYRASAIWVFSTAAMKALRNLKDASTNRPVLLDTQVRTDTDSFGAVSLTPMLFGCPAFESNAFDNAVSTGKNVGFFGNVGRVLPIRFAAATLQRLETRYADYGQVGFVGRQRWDASQIGIAAAGTVIKVQ